SQNKMYSWPASCDSIVSSNGQEDLVSMGANAATKLHKIIDNLKFIAAIELMNAAQGIDFRRPLKSSPYIEEVMAKYREKVAFVDDDVVMEEYIHATMDFLDNFDIVIE
ncbi:MAG: aromatic amino acid lyase, partial [Muribaculaceae bacterium]|nr:aromatic amino acid lyase [Muribaculaceae bacterium]